MRRPGITACISGDMLTKALIIRRREADVRKGPGNFEPEAFARGVPRNIIQCDGNRRTATNEEVQAWNDTIRLPS
jgi:hypothetical protein